MKKVNLSVSKLYNDKLIAMYDDIKKKMDECQKTIYKPNGEVDHYETTCGNILKYNYYAGQLDTLKIVRDYILSFEVTDEIMQRTFMNPTTFSTIMEKQN